jgi:hypothetical protein
MDLRQIQAKEGSINGPEDYLRSRRSQGSGKRFWLVLRKMNIWEPATSNITMDRPYRWREVLDTVENEQRSLRERAPLLSLRESLDYVSVNR